MARILGIFAITCMISLFAQTSSSPLGDLLFNPFSPPQREGGDNGGGVQVGFYNQICPRAEEIVKDVMFNAFQNDSGLAAAMVRLQSHDCLVNGCDGSVLLDQADGGGRVEKQAPANGKTVRGFDLIDSAKEAVEKECPGVVSCADILAFLSRDALVLSGLPGFDVPGGRRDGRASREEDVVKYIASPNNTVDQLVRLFETKGLDVQDMVALLGAHSIGVAHCSNFRYRLKDPKKAREVEGSMKVVMGFQCLNKRHTVPMDSVTNYRMDSVFYRQLLKKKALLESDQLLASDSRTEPLVEKFAGDEAEWFRKFTESFVKMAQNQVLTGDQGEIRRNCRFVN
ncbi:hypothetical protein DM860_009702 [Cuscuta australis]|uniref:Peroxidase n=1 Tax=Cuscuta australis TaxID=267555 RepID=A0A328DCI9_9ASTE|nr:hypothetical protein DM860_009702 [Cuscuta australis]